MQMNLVIVTRRPPPPPEQGCMPLRRLLLTHPLNESVLESRERCETNGDEAKEHLARSLTLGLNKLCMCVSGGVLTKIKFFTSFLSRRDCAAPSVFSPLFHLTVALNLDWAE
jgi:hypothetical protein